MRDAILNAANGNENGPLYAMTTHIPTSAAQQAGRS